MSFSKDIAKFIAATGIKTETVIKRIAFDAFSRVTRKTPVDTGRARANWLVGINTLPTGYNMSAKGSAKATEVNRFKLGDIIYIANSLPYIGVLEYGGYPKSPKSGGVNAKGKPKSVGGFSSQAPQGMVGVTMIEIKANMAKMAREIK